MKHDNNVNVNRVSITPNYNNNVNDNVDKYVIARNAERIADRLMEKLNAPDKWRDFYLKVAYKLPEARIWNNYEKTMGKKVTDPARLFTWLCKKDGV